MLKLLVVPFLLILVNADELRAQQAPQPFQDFSSKSVKPPKNGVKKRITIQVEPVQNIPKPAPDTPAAPRGTPSAVGHYAWYWERMSPSDANIGGHRLEPALLALTGPKGQVRAPRLQQMRSLVETQGIEILKSTIGTNVSPALVLAVIMVESGGDPNAVSRAGAQGLMQLMPQTGQRFGVTNPFAPAQNISGGVKYLDWLMENFANDPLLVLAGYNAGEGSVRKHKGVPPFAETRDYVPKVLAAFQVARGLCLSPPDLISDGCVFIGMR